MVAMAMTANKSIRERLIDRLVSGPLGEKILAEEQLEVDQRRAALLAEIAAAEKAHLADLPGLDKELAAATADRARAHAAVHAAEAALLQANHRRMARSYQADRARSRSLGELQRLAPEAEIKAFRDFLFGVDLVRAAKSRTAPVPLPAIPAGHEYTDHAYEMRDARQAETVRAEIDRINRRRGEVRAEMEAASFLAQPDAAILGQLAEWRTELGG